MQEVWKDISGYDGYYRVSNLGNVMSVGGRKGTRANPITLKQSVNHDGYMKVRLIYNGKDVTARVHRLVAETFIENTEGKDTVNHIDGNKKNNCVDNLEWADRSEQMYHAYRLGLKPPMKGTHNSQAKLTDADVAEIKRTYKRNSKEFGTVALGRKYGVTNVVIGRVVRGVAYLT